MDIVYKEYTSLNFIWHFRVLIQKGRILNIRTCWVVDTKQNEHIINSTMFSFVIIRIL